MHIGVKTGERFCKKRGALKTKVGGQGKEGEKGGEAQQRRSSPWGKKEKMGGRAK